MGTMRIFVSHSHEDNEFCARLVQALRAAGADVWFDEDNLGADALFDTIQRELGQRPVFLVILSPAALESEWVRREAKWAYYRHAVHPERKLLPVTATTLPDDPFSGESGWLFLNDFRRVELPGGQPYPHDEAIRQVLHMLGLDSVTLDLPGSHPNQHSEPERHQTANVDALIAVGKELQAQAKYFDALPIFAAASQLAPDSFDAWASTGHVLAQLKIYHQALAAFDRALDLNPDSAAILVAKGHVLAALGRHDEAELAFQQARLIDPEATEEMSEMPIAQIAGPGPITVLITEDEDQMYDMIYQFVREITLDIMPTPIVKRLLSQEAIEKELANCQNTTPPTPVMLILDLLIFDVWLGDYAGSLWNELPDTWRGQFPLIIFSAHPPIFIGKPPKRANSVFISKYGRGRHSSIELLVAALEKAIKSLL